jgi:hypothetical protein
VRMRRRVVIVASLALLTIGAGCASESLAGPARTPILFRADTFTLQSVNGVQLPYPVRRDSAGALLVYTIHAATLYLERRGLPSPNQPVGTSAPVTNPREGNFALDYDLSIASLAQRQGSGSENAFDRDSGRYIIRGEPSSRDSTITLRYRDGSADSGIISGSEMRFTNVAAPPFLTFRFLRR